MTDTRSLLSCPYPLKRQEVINQIFVTLSTLSYGHEASGLSRVSLFSLTPHTLLGRHTPHPGFSAHAGRSTHGSRAVSTKELLRTPSSASPHHPLSPTPSLSLPAHSAAGLPGHPAAERSRSPPPSLGLPVPAAPCRVVLLFLLFPRPFLGAEPSGVLLTTPTHWSLTPTHPKSPMRAQSNQSLTNPRFLSGSPLLSGQNANWGLVLMALLTAISLSSPQIPVLPTALLPTAGRLPWYFTHCPLAKKALPYVAVL